MPATPPSQVHKLSLPTMTAFGFGQVAEGMKNAGFNTFLLFYYQQVLGVSGTLSGIALGLALVWDALTDPIAGALSDRLETRWGRRHPFILAAALPLGVSFFLLFNPPEGMSEIANFAWLLFFAIAVRTSLTLYHVPHLALGAEMAHDYSQRSTLFAFSTLFGIMGSAITAALAYRFFFPTTDRYDPGLLNPEGYVGFGATFAVLMVVAIGLCAAGTASEIPHLRKQSETLPFSIRQVVREILGVFRSRSFRSLFFGMLFAALVLAVENVFQPFMGVHFWGLRTEQLTYIPIFALAGLLFAVPLTPLLTRVLDKKLALLVPAVFVIVNANVLIVARLADVSWLPANGSRAILALILLTTFVGTTLVPVIFSTINSMFADIADEQELETGQRMEGIIYAARSFALKAASSLGLVFGGIILDGIRFPRGAEMGTVEPDVVWWLGFVQGPGTSVTLLFGLFLFMGYQLDRRRHAEIVVALTERRRERLRTDDEPLAGPTEITAFEDDPPPGPDSR